MEHPDNSDEHNIKYVPYDLTVSQPEENNIYMLLMIMQDQLKLSILTLVYCQKVMMKMKFNQIHFIQSL